MPSIYENTIALSVSQHRFGNRRGIDKQQLSELMPDVDITQDMVAATKRLLDCEEFDAIQKLDTACTQWLRRQCVPSLFRRGIYLVPTNRVDEVDAYLVQYREQRAELVERFLNMYYDSIEQARTKLGVLFKAEQYPSLHRVEACFSVDIHYMDLSVSGRLATLSREIFDREIQAARDRMHEVEQAITALLRQEVLELTTHLINRLRGLDTGETRRFASSNVSNLAEWCQTFLSGRNVVEDSELQAHVERLQEVIEASDSPEVLRDNAAFRSRITRDFEAVREGLEALTERTPMRAMDVDEM
jgi:hypothetical protein